MARIRKHRDKWQVLYRDPTTKRERSAGVFARKSDASRMRISVEHDLQAGLWIDPRRGQISLSEWAVKWTEPRTHLKPSTLAAEQSLLSSRILPTFGEMPLQSIEPTDVDKWIAGMTDEGVSASRIRQAHSLLNRLVKGAVRSRHIAFNPAVGAPLPSLPRQEKSYLSPSEIGHLETCIDPAYRVWLYTMAWTGLRFGEAAALRRRNVDVLRSEIHVVEAVTEVNGKVHFGSTKNNRHRTVYVPGFLRDMLNEQLTTAVGLDPEALVFTSPRGGVLRRHNVGRRVWKPAIRAAGFDGLRMHDLRHTAAALMIAVNESPELVKRQLGHSSIEVTFDVYGHLFPSSMENLVGGLDRLYRAAQAG